MAECRSGYVEFPIAANGANTVVTKSEVFPTKWLKAADLKGQPCVLEIERTALETVKFNGKEQTKLVLYFAGTSKGLAVNATNFDSLVEVTGESDSDN